MIDFVEGNPALKPFYNRTPEIKSFQEQIIEKSKAYNHQIRPVLKQTLKDQYSRIREEDTGPKVIENIDSIGEENTFTVTTGHQLNIFTGPLYFHYKIITVINAARKLKEAYPDYNFVPVYWMASEDHDFDEINYFNFRGKKIQWNSDQSGAVGHFNTDGLEAVLGVISSEFVQGLATVDDKMIILLEVDHLIDFEVIRTLPES